MVKKKAESPKKPRRKALPVTPVEDRNPYDLADHAIASENGSGEEEDDQEERRPPMRILTEADFADPVTFELYHLEYNFRTLQKQRKAADQRKLKDLPFDCLRELPDQLYGLEQRQAKALSDALRRHPLWPWLQKFPGLGGVYMATVLAVIKDPRKFPKPGKPGTGVRAIYKLFGLHCDAEGRLPRRRKGVQSNWISRGRTAFLQPFGIVESVTKQRTPVYRAYYDEQKASLIARRGLVQRPADAPKDFYKRYRKAHPRTSFGPLFQGEAHTIARTIVAKKILGDLFMAWKHALAEQAKAA